MIMNEFKLLTIIGILSCVFGCSHGNQANEVLEYEEIQPVRRLGVDYEEVVCLAGKDVVRNHVPFSKLKELREELLAKGGTLGDFQVNYNGFTTEARDAFQFAVDIWDLLLDSDALIVVSAQFADLGAGVLGSAGPTGFFVDFDPKADPGVEYSAPLAEKIAGRSLNGPNADLSCSFNNTTNWYFDTDNPEGISNNEFDFATVVLHELGHGIGFLSRHTFADATTGLGVLHGPDNVDTDIFSLLLEEEDGTNLFLNYETPSREIGSALLGNNLFFRSHTVPQSPPPQIFAPSPWNQGSSLSHLDEVTHAGANALMTPSVGRAEVIHDPGLSLTMLYDMGWRSTFIAHEPVSEEIVNAPVPILADVISDDGVGFDSSKVRLVLSEDNFATVIDTFEMIGSSGSSQFEVSVPGKAVGEYQYYFFIDDRTNMGLTNPKLAPNRYHSIFTGVDRVQPVIDHDPVTNYFLDEGVPLLEAEVFDAFTGVDVVTVEWFIEGGNTIELDTMSFLEEQGYIFRFSELEDDRTIGAGDFISYRIIAHDQSDIRNTAVLPSAGEFFRIAVVGVPEPTDFYFTDFDDADNDFSLDGMSIATVDGFEGPALHSEHPYQNNGVGNLNFIANLRVPFIITSEEAKMEFDEVVLVEPGEAGSSFGDNDFWDFVIVEARILGTNNWFSILDGYDSSERTEWRNRYTNGLAGQDSSSGGDEDIEFRRTIPLFQPNIGLDLNTTVEFRWRLFSDPFAVGWGWSVDSLEISNPNSTTPVVVVDAEDREISIAPNPIIDDVLRLTIKGDMIVESFTIADASGRLIQTSNVQLQRGDQQEVPLRNLRPGAYFVLFETEDVWVTKPFLKL